MFSTKCGIEERWHTLLVLIIIKILQKNQHKFYAAEHSDTISPYNVSTKLNKIFIIFVRFSLTASQFFRGKNEWHKHQHTEYRVQHAKTLNWKVCAAYKSIFNRRFSIPSSTHIHWRICNTDSQHIHIETDIRTICWMLMLKCVLMVSVLHSRSVFFSILRWKCPLHIDEMVNAFK